MNKDEKAIAELEELIYRINYEEDFYVEEYHLQRIIDILSSKESV